MDLRWTLLATCAVAICAGGAKAQFGPAPAGPQNAPPCVQEFTKLREEAEKRGAAIKAASERKAPPREACQLFNVFISAQSKMVKYATDNAAWCGIPDQVIASLKDGLAKTSDIRTKVCQAAAAPRSTGPSLSDALSNPVPNSNNIKTGRGTFDTLTGSPLGK